MSDDVFDFTPSEEANKKMVCHTFEECDVMYENLNPDIKARAIEFLQSKLPSEERHDLRKVIKGNPGNWVGVNHLFWGMGIRNLLRQGGFGERQMGVHNLDDIYIPLVEEAVTGKWTKQGKED